jgi:hypothetical protein
VALLYEGTNEIQALDLLSRKLAPDGGAALRELLQTLPPGDGDGDAGERLLRALDTLFAADVPPGLAAPLVLRAVGLVLLERLWRAADAAAAHEGDVAFARRKRATAAVFRQQVLPELGTLLTQLQALAADARGQAEALAASCGLGTP